MRSPDGSTSTRKRLAARPSLGKTTGSKARTNLPTGKTVLNVRTAMYPTLLVYDTRGPAHPHVAFLVHSFDVAATAAGESVLTLLAPTSTRSLSVQDPTVALLGDECPSDPPPTPRQDHAVLAWLATEPVLPELVQAHLLDALDAWAPLMGSYLFPVEPEAGPECDLAQVIEAMWWRYSEQAPDAPWYDKVALTELCGRLGLALAELRAPRPRAGC